MSRHRPEPLLRSLLVRSVQAGILALALGAFLWILGLRPFGATVTICAIFSYVLWLGFHLCRPLMEVPHTPGRPALRVALISTLRMALVYSGLLLVCVFLVRLSLGLNLFARMPFALLTYLLGFTITVSINGFHLTVSLVEAERSRAETEAERLRQARELERARKLQLDLLPSEPPAMDVGSMAWAMHTATEVGGDHFDTYQDAQGVLHGIFGDATGHGLQAGMVVVAVKGLFRTGGGDPEADLHHIGRGVKALGLPNTAMAATLWKLEGRRLSLAHAGMPPPLWWRAAEGTVESLPLKAPPVGQLSHPKLATHTLELAAGDMVLFCSDGLPECFDPQGRMFGYGRVAPCFKSLAPQGPEVVIAGLWQAAEAHAGGHPLEDDLSLFVLKV